jgi:predicted subunit of tRNA(5-methylaminomethyl-2-thiouridylate) methyltransferase
MTQPAFAFILDYLFPLEVRIKPMFGCHAIYHEDKILLIVRNKPEHEESNGIWIATSFEHHSSLKKEIGELMPVGILNGGKGETAWQMIHPASPMFEANAMKICELIRNGDKRIGRVPKRKKRKSSSF